MRNISVKTVESYTPLFRDDDRIGGNAGGKRSLGTELRRFITRQGVDRLHAGIDEEHGVGRHHVAFLPQPLLQ
mgnify:CR=1 FL=1